MRLTLTAPTLRRVGVPDLEVRDADPVTSLEWINHYEEPGDFIDEGAIPRALSRAILNSYAGEEPEPSASTLITDWADVSDAILRIEEFISLVGRNGGCPLAEAEVGQAKKAMLQRGRAPLWHAQKGGMVRSGFRVPDSLKLIAATLLATPSTLGGDATPRHTNHSWPDWSNSDLSLLMHAALSVSSKDWSEVKEHAALAAHDLGVHGSIPHSAVLFTRTGHWSKYARLWREADGWRSSSEVKGGVCRTRLVYGMPTFHNLYMRPVSLDVKSRLVNKWPHVFHHTGPENDRISMLTQLEHASRWWRGRVGSFRPNWLEQDFSGYDLHVPEDHQRAISELLYAPVFQDWGRDVDAYNDTITLPVLAPRLRPNDGGYLYKRRGQTMSGSIFTTTDGCIFSLAIFIDAIAAGYGWTVNEAWNNFNEGAIPCGAWGDDVLFIVHRSRFDEQRYLRVITDLGHEAKLVEGRTLLMTWHGDDGSYNLASRCLMGTLFREHGTLDPDIELLGFWSRFRAARGNPYWRTAVHLTTRDNWLSPWGRNWDALDEYVTSPGFLTKLATKLRANPSLAGRLLESLTRGERDPRIAQSMAPLLASHFPMDLLSEDVNALEAKATAQSLQYWVRQNVLTHEGRV